MFRHLFRIIRTLLVVLAFACASPIVTKAKLPNSTLWLVTDNESHTALAMRPVDAVTLQNIPGFTPISMGHHYTVTLNADQTLMAAIVWPDGYNTNGVLHLIDLNTGKDQIMKAVFNDYVTTFSFSTDGKSLFWLIGTATDPTHEITRDHALFACEIADCVAPTPIVILPTDFVPVQAKWIVASSQLAIFGFPTDINFLANKIPQIIFVDLAKKTNRGNFDSRGTGCRTAPRERPQDPADRVL